LHVAATVLAAAPGRAEAKGQCHKINTTLTSVADFTTFTTTGEIKSGFLKGTTVFTGDGASLALITSVPSPPVEPFTFSYTGDLVVTTPKGTLTTRGVGVFKFSPFGLGSQFDRVIGGTGFFEGAEGHLYFDIVTDETGAVFTNQVTGEVCLE
jgi:hypothetical protein